MADTMPQAAHIETFRALLRDSTLHPSVHAAYTAAIEAMQRQGEPVAWLIQYRDGGKIAAFEQPAPSMFEALQATITPLIAAGGASR